MRQYGRDRLHERGEMIAQRKRHRNWYLSLAEQAEPGILGAQQATWFDGLETEHDNLRAGLAYSLEQADAESAARIWGAIVRLWLIRGYLSEGRGWLGRGLQKLSGRANGRA